MRSTVGIVIPSYGDKAQWDKLAARAIDSVNVQTRMPNEVIRVHDDTLAKARNKGIERCMSEYVICLDADDELDPYYIEAMLRGYGDIRQPSTLGVVNGVEDDAPVLIPRKPLFEGNYIVIGAMFKRMKAIEVGGFRELTAFEDWDLWVRMTMNGALVTSCPEAVYRVNVRQNSRNQTDDTLFHRLKAEYLAMPGVENIR